MNTRTATVAKNVLTEVRNVYNFSSPDVCMFYDV